MREREDLVSDNVREREGEEEVRWMSDDVRGRKVRRTVKNSFKYIYVVITSFFFDSQTRS